MIIFVADAFAEHYTGGAELTTEALITSSRLPVAKALCQRITVHHMKEHQDAFWVFGNFFSLSEQCMQYAIKNLKYSVLEYDYKYCVYRSPEKHVQNDGACDCAESYFGRLRALFLASAVVNWWMSEEQKSVYVSKFPFMKGNVLSSVLSQDTLAHIEHLQGKTRNNKWIILDSSSWIKGTEDAVQYAKKNNLDYELVRGLEHKKLLEKLASSKGLIFLPRGGDTCPRIVIEAKLLGCELILNENVQHAGESWFESQESCLEHMRTRCSVFWNRLEQEMPFLPRDSKSPEQQYHIVVPFFNAEEYLPRCIESIKKQEHQDFICTVIDDMSTDNSWDVLSSLVEGDSRFRIVKNTEKTFALGNIVKAIGSYDKGGKEIIVVLDGDDWFSSGLVLRHLDSFYEDDECWVTYGSYLLYPHGVRGPEPSEYPPLVKENNAYRKDTWRASHLRTFRRHLWDRINLDDLKDSSGNFYKMAYDQAIMLPLLEMSSERQRYVPEIMHVYNRINPLNVDKLKAHQQASTAAEIRSKKPYERVE